MCFTNKRIRQIPSIKIGNEEIEFTNKHDILGLRFDSPKLNWKEHIQNVKKITLRKIDIMKKISSRTWRANIETLLKFYNIYIKPKTEYGLSVYGNAKNTELKKLEIIQNSALRLGTGSFKSTPIT